MRTALLAILAAMAVSLLARAETIVVTSDPVPLDKTEYEIVDAADAFLLARATGASGEDVDFKIEEVLKGPPSMKSIAVTGCLVPLGEDDGSSQRCDYRKGAHYAFFLVGDEEGWRFSPDFAFDVEVKPEDESWFGALRLFAGISALDDDEREEQALRELRDAALAEPERYPAKLVRMIDLHFGRPSTSKPFAALLDLYLSAWNDRERLEVLRTLRHVEHVETAGFFRGLLLGGEPLWLMKPVLEWMSDNPEEAPLLKDLARVWLAHPAEDRTGLLELMLELAEPGDVPLLWSLLVSSSGTSLEERQKIVLWALDEVGPDPLSLPPDESLRKDLLLVWLDDDGAGLEALLRSNDIRDWRTVPRVENLVEAFEASRRPAERRQILTELAYRDWDNLGVIWRLLRGASDGEAEVLLQWASFLDAPRGLLVDYYRGAADEEQRNRALWLLFAVAVDDEVGPLLSVTGALGEGSVHLERVVQAFQTCPNAVVRSQIAFHAGNGLAEAGDLPAVLRILDGASLDEARELAPWLALNPAPEARALLWRLPIPSLYEEKELAGALAAAGDSEVLDMAIELRRRLMTEDDPWPYFVLLHSPLPTAEEEARRLLDEGGYNLDQLLWVLGEEESANPWRERFLRDVAESAPSEATRQNALNFLERFFGEDEEPDEPPEP